MEAGTAALEELSPHFRPRDTDGDPGGLVQLRPEVPTIVVPDIHARADLVVSVLGFRSARHGIDVPLIDALAEGRAQLVFVGDYVHAEARARERWRQAFQEFQTGYSRRAAMDEEMAESLGTLQTVALLFAALPQGVIGLKGNHENIANEDVEGNMPFGKFVYEGAMVAEYMNRFYAGRPFETVYRFEKSLPLLAVGSSFIVGHAEPARFVGRDELINGMGDPDVVSSLTWTANDEAESGSVAQMLEHYLPHADSSASVYLGGHRPVTGLFTTRAMGKYVQIHNPDLFVAAALSAGRPFDPARDVVEIPDNRSALNG